MSALVQFSRIYSLETDKFPGNFTSLDRFFVPGSLGIRIILTQISWKLWERILKPGRRITRNGEPSGAGASGTSPRYPRVPGFLNWDAGMASPLPVWFPDPGT